MAQGKKSFIVYTDWKETFEALPDDKAGQLIKHILRYVSDEDPQTEDIVIKAVFATMKHTLIRDLKKWEKAQLQRVEAGKASARQRKITKANDRSTTVQRAPTVNGNVSVSVIENDNKKYKKKLLSSIVENEIPPDEVKYFKLAKRCQQLFISLRLKLKTTTPHQQNARYQDYVGPIKLMFEKDKITIEQFEVALKALEEIPFWWSNIGSTAKFREKAPDLIAQYNTPQIKGPVKNSRSPYQNVAIV